VYNRNIYKLSTYYSIVDGNMNIEEYVKLNYPNKKQTRYNIKSQLVEFFDFIQIKSEEYVKQDREFKKDVQLYFGHLINTPRSRTKKPYAPKTIIVHMSTVRGYLEEHDIIFSPRFWKKILKRGKGNEIILEDRIPTREELDKILTHGDARDRAFFFTMLSCGMREEELCRITFDMIDFDSNPVMIKIPARISKTKKKRITFISVEAKNALMEWKKIRSSYIERKQEKSKGLYDYLEKKYGTKVNGTAKDRVFPYEPLATRIWWNRLLNKAGFTDKDENTGYFILHLYTLRKFFNTRMKSVCNRDMLEFWMGHKLPYDYDKWTDEEHKKEYLKGMGELLVYRTPANIEEMETLQKKVDEIKNLKQQMDEMQKQIRVMGNKKLDRLKELEKQGK